MGFKRILNKNNIKKDEAKQKTLKKALMRLKNDVEKNGSQYNFRNVNQFIEHTIKKNSKDLIGQTFFFTLSKQEDLDAIAEAIDESQKDKDSLAWILFNSYMQDETGKNIKIDGEDVVYCYVECVGEFVE